MGKFVKGDIVVIRFPFSDLSSSKRRPALVLADLDGEDVILCQITSHLPQNAHAVHLNETDYEDGALSVDSYIRPDKLFTASEGLIVYKACRAKLEKVQSACELLAAIINA